MKVRRRRMGSRPLLVAGAGAMMLASGCDGKDSGPAVGNLVPPAEVELCVTVTPDTAEISVNGAVLPLDDRCEDVYEGSVLIAATAEGYEDYEESLDIFEDTTVNVEMIPTDGK